MMIATANAIYFLVRMLWMYDSFSIWHWLGLGILIASHGISYHLLSLSAKATYSESGALLDVGTDLNLEGGMPEYFKDLIILTTAVQVLSIISDYFWLLMLAAPAYASYLLWGSVIQPWLTAGSELMEVDEKTKKKMARKEHRMQKVIYR
jgi:hypothetical protein